MSGELTAEQRAEWARLMEGATGMLLQSAQLLMVRGEGLNEVVAELAEPNLAVLRPHSPNWDRRMDQAKRLVAGWNALPVLLAENERLRAALGEIVAQLQLCDYECEGGKLENNVEFIRLAALAACPEQAGGAT